MVAPVENAVIQWEEGYARVQATRLRDASVYRAVGRVVTGVERVLRKRLGSRFSVAELADLYRDQADSLLDEALLEMPGEPPLGDATAACDAAFYLYMREAFDFGGGGRRPAAR